MTEEAYKVEFARLTDMLAPGFDEADAKMGQTHFTRTEVRELLWKMYLWGKERALDSRSAHA